MKRHQCTTAQLFYCGICRASFQSNEEKETHEGNSHKPFDNLKADQVGSGNFFREVQNSFKCSIYEYQFSEDIEDVNMAFFRIQKQLTELLQHFLRRRKILKYKLVMVVRLLKLDGSSFKMPKRTRARSLLLSEMDVLEEYIREDRDTFANRIQGVEEREGSGDSLQGIETLRVEINSCDLWGGCQSSDLDESLFENLRGKQHLLNVSGRFSRCFYYALCMDFVSPSQRQDIDFLDQFLEKNFHLAQGQKFNDGMLLSKIRYFEKRNEHLGRGINVF